MQPPSRKDSMSLFHQWNWNCSPGKKEYTSSKGQVFAEWVTLLSSHASKQLTNNRHLW